MAEQNINLPGTRVDTLWITVESGTDENGDEYEKKQVIAPRTFEEAVTDKNKVPLSKKLADLLERINQLNGGEYDTLLVEIDNIKQEIAGLDLGQWDYNVPSGKVINFVNDGNKVTMGIDPKNSDLVVTIFDNELIRFKNVGDQVDFLYGAVFKDSISVELDSWFCGRVFFEDGIDVTGTTIFHDVIDANGGINAPNIASTAELMSLGGEITEQDIITIETQQSVTEQDINNIETQQTLTDMELIMIGGQVA